MGSQPPDANGGGGVGLTGDAQRRAREVGIVGLLP